MEIVCAHAIASNAVANMWNTVKAKQMKEQVETELKALDDD